MEPQPTPLEITTSTFTLPMAIEVAPIVPEVLEPLIGSGLSISFLYFDHALMNEFFRNY